MFVSTFLLCLFHCWQPGLPTIAADLELAPNPCEAQMGIRRRWGREIYMCIGLAVHHTLIGTQDSKAGGGVHADIIPVPRSRRTSGLGSLINWAAGVFGGIVRVMTKLDNAQAPIQRWDG